MWIGGIGALSPPVALEVCNSEERARARRFAASHEAADYLTARALLRHLLAAYAGQSPEAISIETQKDGKPLVAGLSIAFNLSHSGSHVAIALRHGESVGVDVQRAKEIDELAIARSLFAPGEIALLEGLSRDERRRHFFRVWTCREAVLKAAGLGMKGRGLVLQAGAEGDYEVCPRSPGWSQMRLKEFSPAIDSYGALAWPETASRPRVRQFSI